LFFFCRFALKVNATKAFDVWRRRQQQQQNLQRRLLNLAKGKKKTITIKNTPRKTKKAVVIVN